jgi:hypothetical protein
MQRVAPVQLETDSSTFNSGKQARQKMNLKTYYWITKMPLDKLPAYQGAGIASNMLYNHTTG